MNTIVKTIAALSAITIGLTACLGGGSSTTATMTPEAGTRPTLMEPAPTRGSAEPSTTTPIPVEFQGTSFDSIHLERTDTYWRLKGTGPADASNLLPNNEILSAVAKLRNGDASALSEFLAALTDDDPSNDPPTPAPILSRETVRQEVVCPGLAHNGNDCSAGSLTIDGERTVDAEAVYPNLGLAEILFQLGIVSADVRSSVMSIPGAGFVDPMWVDLASVNGMGKARGSYDTLGTRTMIDTGYGDYSMFFVLMADNGPDAVQFATGRPVAQSYITFAAAFGNLYRNYPGADQGSATWRGAMVGATRAEATPLSGNSLLEYDFSDDTLDLTLDQIAATDPGASYTGPSSFVWEALQANADGSFYIPGYGNDKPGTTLHPTLGYVDGDFYGPNAAEFGGVFEREGVVGAFGGKRVPE